MKSVNKPKDYINSRQRQNILGIILSIGIAEDILKDDNTKEEIKHLKKIQEWGDKYLKTLVPILGKEEMQRIQKMLNDMEVTLKVKTPFANKYSLMEVDSLDELIRNAVLNQCHKCDGNNFLKCKFFKLQDEAGIYMVDKVDKKGKCPYAYHIKCSKCDEHEGKYSFCPHCGRKLKQTGGVYNE